MERNSINYSVKADLSDPVLKFGSAELNYFLNVFGNHCVEEKERTESDQWFFELSVNKDLKDHSFSISCRKDKTTKDIKVSLQGENNSCVLSAIYTFLEKAGIMFEITGPVLPPRLLLENTLDWAEQICPAVKYRGIRQHINFPMDISSYALEDAREYIRNVARMRFNHISFHSYYGQWYRAELPDRKIRAGWFFYGQVHRIPDHPVLRANIKNKGTFCIPEIEPAFDDLETRSAMAVHWLKEVFAEAKNCGLNLQLSIEGWNSENNVRETHDTLVEICNSVVADYPCIDRLELMTRECGGYEGRKPRETVLELLSNLYGREFVEKENLKSMLSESTNEIAGIAFDIAENLKVLTTLEKQWDGGKKPALTLGVYATDTEALKISLIILRSFVPENIDLSFLSAHGARDVYESVAGMGFTREDISRSMFYSWSEFDGDMYLFQNSVEGNHDMLSYLQRKCSGQIAGYAVNHWRTSENKTTLRYVAEAALLAPVGSEEFYRTYGGSHSIKPLKDFVKAMKLIDLSEIDVRKLSNLAFSFVGCWVADGKLGYISVWEKSDIPQIERDYDAIIHQLKICLQRTENPMGREHIEFLLNRIECSAIYIRAINKIMEVKDIVGTHPKDELNEDERYKVRRICDQALSVAEEYMARHVELMPDRGCQGTLISFYYTLPAYIKRLRVMYGEGKDTDLCRFISPDAPPSPE